MGAEHKIILALVGLAATIVLTIALSHWRKSKGRTSIFATDTSLEGVGMSALSSIGDTAAPRRTDGWTELRPTWGTRAVMPALACFFLTTVDFGPFLASLGIDNDMMQVWIICGLYLLLAYSVIQLNVFQRVVYNHSAIACVGVDTKRQDRSLRDLVDIKVHDKRPALVLTFADQPTLYVPKFISHRARFIADMEAVVMENRTTGGMQVPPDNLAARMGF